MNLKLDSNLKIAIILALVLNSAIVFSGFYQRNYDSYGHMFFADHYQKSWFDSWEPRWYMGFNVASYPPLAHQILALLGFVTGIELAYVIITLVLMVLLPISVYRFSKVVISEEAAGYAAIISVFLPGILMSVYGWGHYTTIFSLVMTLFAASSFHKFVTKGGLFYFAELIFLFEVAVASHHYTGLVFTPVLLLATLLTIIAKKEISFKKGLKRYILFIAIGLTLSIFIVYPVLFSAVGQGVNIPHPTTQNLFQNFGLFQLFFFDMYGFFLLLIPLTVIMVRYRKDLLPLAFLALFLFVLGLGGSTPLPQAIFGENWLGLTYERFNLFSVLTFAPLFGLVFVFLKGKKSGKNFLVIFMIVSILFSGLAVNNLLLRPHNQEVPVDSLVDFLNLDQHWRWRYLTLGFEGSDFCKLSLYSNATTIDGWYYRGRNITELANSSVGFLNDAKFYEKGIPVLRSVLENSSQYHLRFVFCNDKLYEPLLNETGFTLLDIKYEQVTIWAKYDSTQLELNQILNSNHVLTIQEYSWGIIPIAWLAGLLFLEVFNIRRNRKKKFL
jgi:hypothetical protein